MPITRGFHFRFSICQTISCKEHNIVLNLNDEFMLTCSAIFKSTLLLISIF